ncbi:hypothetical protein E2320_015889 [Naja naja]|nr:hypothetical protein E2320_015889 [Naja naja]
MDVLKMKSVAAQQKSTDEELQNIKYSLQSRSSSCLILNPPNHLYCICQEYSIASLFPCLLRIAHINAISLTLAATPVAFQAIVIQMLIFLFMLNLLSSHFSLCTCLLPIVEIKQWNLKIFNGHIFLETYISKDKVL